MKKQSKESATAKLIMNEMEKEFDILHKLNTKKVLFALNVIEEIIHSYPKEDLAAYIFLFVQVLTKKGMPVVSKKRGK